MGEIRLYRKFYCASVSTIGGTDEYNLINPYSLSANTFVAGTGNTQTSTIIESGLNIIQSETGIYYVDLDPISYAADIIYDLVWYVEYIENSPNKKLVTRFKVNPVNIGQQIEIEYTGSKMIEIEVLGNY